MVHKVKHWHNLLTSPAPLYQMYTCDHIALFHNFQQPEPALRPVSKADLAKVLGMPTPPPQEKKETPKPRPPRVRKKSLPPPKTKDELELEKLEKESKCTK